jgi:hypothetical protein
VLQVYTLPLFEFALQELLHSIVRSYSLPIPCPCPCLPSVSVSLSLSNRFHVPVCVRVHFSGTSMIHPHTIRPCTLHPDLFTSPYVSSLQCGFRFIQTYSHEKCVRLSLNLLIERIFGPFIPKMLEVMSTNPTYGQSYPAELHQPVG